jgi:hypothetical protein
MFDVKGPETEVAEYLEFSSGVSVDDSASGMRGEKIDLLRPSRRA